MPSTLLTGNSYVANSGDNTAFRAYGTAISNAFANAGWVQTSDTGQIDWATVVANGTANATFSLGYQIWRMNDALQNTAPVYVKLDWRTTYINNSPGLIFTIGAGSDGSGNLTGNPSLNIAMRSSSASSANPWPAYFRGNPGDITICMWANSVNVTAWVLNIERCKDAGGNDTANGVAVVWGGIVSGGVAVDIHQYVYIPGIGATSTEASLGIFGPTGNTVASGYQTLMFPIFCYKGVTTYPLLNIIGAHVGLAAPNAPFTVPLYGNNHTYITPIYTDRFTTRISSTAGVYSIALRWE
jgi:hypothetical protein